MILSFSIIGVITVVSAILAPETPNVDRRVTAAQLLDEEEIETTRQRVRAE
ncbi:hypothetical protein [Pseudarthrobacter sp. S9]|uniref:hypothetical protein n=1 Tax=Pseudarthrobacter sp. S9 TaxID=3418421 RepID=UPI003D07D0CF